MTLLDWLILWVPVVLVLGVSFYTVQFNRSVVDYIAAGRVAGRYLMATAGGEAGSAAITAIALFQMTTKTGFAFQYWAPLYATVPILLAIAGWVTYRFRETRAMTNGQFFEMRYSRRFRLFMGVLGFLSGIMGYGIAPAINAHFFVYFLDLPQTINLFHMAFPTWQVIALAYLSCCLLFVLTGGAISVLVTDTLEGIFSQVAYMVIIIVLLAIFGWHEMTVRLTSTPPHQSMVNPFDMGNTKDFNIYFILISLIMAPYAGGGSGSAGKTPHEQRMAGILGNWRKAAFSLMRTILAICAVTFLMNPSYSHQAVAAHAQLSGIADTATQDQMTVPIAAAHFLPAGIKGLFCAIMLMGVLTGDAGALHGMGSGFIQDVVLPLRKKSMTPREHILYLRLASIAVAAFAFCFSSFFHHMQYIQLYWQVIGAVYGGGAGAVFLGGLYWKKGTTFAAWATMFIGATFALTGVTLQNCGYTFVLFGQDLLHGQYVAFFTMLLSISVYFTLSRLTWRSDFNMDRMLHRGEYAVAGEEKKVAPPIWKRFSPARIIGIDEEFSFWDRVIAFGLFGWIATTFAISMIGLAWNMIHPWTTENWLTYWFIFGLVIPFIVSLVTTVWFTIGGIREIGIFFRNLRVERRDDRDDGTVGPGHPV